ncbi:MAG TPA: hypothetical protein PKV17_12680, partial [Aquabacterium sp.]|nr:hypothetical protein [Aquabacterium sp.]
MTRSLLRACSSAIVVACALSALIAPMANAQTSDGPQNADAAPAHTSYLKQVAAHGLREIGRGGGQDGRQEGRPRPDEAST